MKEKIKKLLLWIVLIWFTLVFIGSFIEAIMIVLFGLNSSSMNPLVLIFVLAFSALIIIKLQKKLNVSSLFDKQSTNKKSTNINNKTQC